MKKFAAAIALIVLSGCAAPTAEERAAADRIKVTGARFQQTRNCADPALMQTRADMETLFGGVVRSTKYNAAVAGPMSRPYADAEAAARGYLEWGDGMLKWGCFDHADWAYRKVLENFLGSRYDAYRQRAMVGINDVNLKRQRG